MNNRVKEAIIVSVDIDDLCFAMVADTDMKWIMDAPPVAKWCETRRVFDVVSFYVKKGAQVTFKKIIFSEDGGV